MRIFKSESEIYKDLRSGNFLWAGCAYPNAIDWDMVNFKVTEIWRELTKIDANFYPTVGTSSMLDLLSRGKNILALAPCYDGAIKIFRDNGCVVLLYWNIEEMLGCTHEIDYLYLNTYFRNPDWYSFSEDEKDRLVDFCRRGGITIIEDDPYFFLTGDIKRRNFLEIYEKTIYLNSFSKCLGSPGMRFGCFACSDQEMREEILGKMRLRFMYGNPYNLAEWLDIEVGDLWKFVDNLRESLEEKRKTFKFEGFYIWGRKDEYYERLLKAGFLVKDGSDFGVEGFYRVSLAHLPLESGEYSLLYNCFRI